MVRVCGSMERPYAKGIFGSYHYNNSSSNNKNGRSSSSSISGSSRHNKQTQRKTRCGGGSSSRCAGWWYFLKEFGSNLNIIMVLTTMCIMMASAGVTNTASTAAATRIGGATGGSDNSESSSNNAANSHHNGYSGRGNDGGGGSNDGRSSSNNNNNNGRNPYHHHHQYRDREHVHPDISDSSSHYSNNNNNNGGGGGSGGGGSSSSTNPFAYWTSVTHHYNSYITHPNYHFSSSSSGSPYNYNNGHTYTFGVLLNSENEASTALFLNASTPATPSKNDGGDSSASSNNSSSSARPSSKYTLFQQILIAWGATCLGLLTVVGNILVMISFKIDKQLQTISNYFLFSLAVADFLIGTVGMPLTTVYLLAGYWPFGERVCDAWLAVDYLTSNASVLNLLMISFDRYFSVTRPLTYRAKRTTRRAAVMISAAWGISLLLWPPWIYAWPYIEGKRTVPEYKCYIQFIETNHYITFGTAIAAFYIPVSIMLFLYYRIYMETEKRQRDLSQLQAGKKESSRRSNSSDEAMDVEEWKRMRSGSCTCQDHLDQSPSCPAHKRQSPLVHWLSKRWNCLARACEVCIGFCRVDRDADDPDEAEEEHVSPGTPASIETPLQSSVSRCTSLNVIRDPMAQTPTRRNDSVVSPVQTQSSNPSQPVASAAATVTAPASSGAGASGGSTSGAGGGGASTTGGTAPTPGAPKEGSNGKLPTSESVYTILIRIPGETEGKNASIRMIQEPGPLPPPPVPGHHQRAKTLSSNPESVYSSGSSASAGGSAGAGGSGSGGSGSVGGLARRPSSAAPPLHAKIVPKPLTSKGSAGAISATSVVPGQVKRKKKKNQEKKQEKKAAKTLSAILLAFIVTWTPYNILVLLKTIMVEEEIPEILWDAAYYLCYINSTINPMCYALCNASFRRTYIRILTCKWENTRRQAVQRGYYN